MSSTPRPFMVLHVSDVHAVENGLLYDAIDPLARLNALGETFGEGLGAALLDERSPLDVVIVTGDLVQRGHPGAYPAVERALRGLEARLGVPVITVLGNHDDVTASRVLTGHRDDHYGVATVSDTRIVRLDSHTRELGAAQLDWLRGVLAKPSGRGTILALHHAPVASPMPILRKQGLADAAALAEVIANSDVRAILAGHTHHALAAHFAGIPVFVAPALAYHQVMQAGPTEVAGHDASWCALMRLDEQAAVHTPIELQPGPAVFTQAAASS